MLQVIASIETTPLPVWQRIEFKVADLVYNTLNCLSPHYLMDDCQLIVDMFYGIVNVI